MYYIPENLLVLLFTGFEAGAALCCPDAGVSFAGSLCALTTGATVAVAFGLAGGFLFCGDFALLGDSSDSEEYTIGLGFGGCLSLFFSRDCMGIVSVLDLTWRVVGNGGFFLVLSVSDTFWLLAELLEFSESDELDSLSELEELLDEEPELLVDEDSELVVWKNITLYICNNYMLLKQIVFDVQSIKCVYYKTQWLLRRWSSNN